MNSSVSMLLQETKKNQKHSLARNIPPDINNKTVTLLGFK